VSQGPASPTEADIPDLSSFLGMVATDFQVTLDEGRIVELTLVEVDHSDRRTDWESFVLLFQSSGELLGQATYTLQHGTLGSFALFLVPVLGDPLGHRYEAVLNRPIS